MLEDGLEEQEFVCVCSFEARLSLSKSCPCSSASCWLHSPCQPEQEIKQLKSISVT